MNKVKVKIMYDDLHDDNDNAENSTNFEIVLNKTGWFKFDGEWNCLPGYMKQTKGYFTQHTISGKGCLYMIDRESTLKETFMGDGKREMYIALDGFTDSPKVGMSGKGSAYRLGAKGQTLFTDGWGKVNSFIQWKITEVN